MDLEPGWYLFGPRNQNMKSIRLKEGVTVLGRGDANDIQILEVEISRNHCSFEANSNRLTITDLKSCNGSYVKDAQIKPSLPVNVSSGDSIGLGISPTAQVISNLVFKAVYKPTLSYDFPELTEDERFWLFGKRKNDDESSGAKKAKVDDTPMSPLENKSDSDDDVIFVCRRELSHFLRPLPPKNSEMCNFSQDEGAIILIDSDEESQISETFVSPHSRVNLNIKIKEEPEDEHESEEEPLVETEKPIPPKPIFHTPEAKTKVKKTSASNKNISQSDKKKLIQSRREKLKEIASKTKTDEEIPKEKKATNIKVPNIPSRSEFLSKPIEKKNNPPRKVIEIPIEEVHRVRPKRTAHKPKERKKDEKSKIQENGIKKPIEKSESALIKHINPKVVQYNWSNRLKTSSRVYDICGWNTLWLKEARDTKGDPKLSRMPPVKVENVFLNFDHYKNCMQSLLLSEFFHQAVDERILQECKAKPYSIFYGIIEKSYDQVVHHERVLKICECTIVCERYVENNLMMKLADVMETMVIYPKDQKKCKWDMFSVVGEFLSGRKLRPIDSGNEYVKILVDEQKKKKKDVYYWFRAVLIFKSSPSKELNNNTRLFLRPSINSFSLIRMNEAIQKVFVSPLMKTILDPDIFMSPPPSSQKPVTHLPLNNEQSKAVLSCSESILSKKPSISLIHGPPGTGKTQVITCLILQVLHHMKKNKESGRDKILICAQTNAAIDEIALRLLKVCEEISGDYKIVRCGNPATVHRDVRKINPTILARRRLEGSDFRQTYLSSLQEEEKVLKQLCFDPTKSDLMKQKYKEDLSKIQIKIKNLGGRSGNLLDAQILCEEERKIIQNADIVVSTLSSCFTSSINNALYARYQNLLFSCCIIDEATQAIEPEVLVPILHSIENFVLVGDPLQLPPLIQSKVSKDFDFDKSLYHRIWSIWNTKNDAPLYKLKVQYRMHPEIVSFPSKLFYDNSIITPSTLDTKEPFRHYSVIEHSFQQDEKKEFNKDEAKLVVRLLDFIKSSDIFKNMSIGIISPYVQHKDIIQKMMRKDIPNLMVDTIDSFQGKEKDIVILSCVRTERMGFLFDKKRVNVALTRARKCLIIIGNFRSLGKDPTWKSLLDDAGTRHCIFKLNSTDAVSGSSKVFDFIANKKNLL